MFVPLDDSPIVDQGIAIEGINDDFKGKASDLGAYELGGEYWVPGVNWKPSGFAWTPGTDYLNVERNFKKYKLTNNKL